MNPYSHLTDEQLMSLYQKGENMAFEVIYNRNKGRIYSYLNKRISDDSAIDEIFQNILLKFHNSRMSYDPKYPFGKWIFTISKSELLDFRKKRKFVYEDLKDEHLLSENSDTSEKIDLYEIKNLSENERSAIALRYYSEKDFLEISRLLNVSESNVRKLISRGLKKVRLKFTGGQNDWSF